MEHLASYALAWDELLFLLLPLPLIVIANLHDHPPPDSRAATVGRAIWILLGMVAAVCVLDALFTMAATRPAPRVAIYAAVLLATGVAAAALLAEPVRAGLARVMPIDARSAVHATALVLSIVVVGLQLASQLTMDVLSQQAAAAALGPADLVLGELPFLAAAALGVGLFVHRGPRATLTRLGVVRPTIWQLVLGLGAAGLFYAFGYGVDALGQHVTPGLAEKVQAANDHLFGDLVGPLGIATIALSAGICEEALFRGAMQPRLGIVWTAVVFTTVHSQYGLSLEALAVLALALGLGLLRRLTNTTTTMTCHVVYNTLVGVGVAVATTATADALLLAAAAVGIVLVGASAGAFLTGRLGSLSTAS